MTRRDVFRATIGASLGAVLPPALAVESSFTKPLRVLRDHPEVVLQIHVSNGYQPIRRTVDWRAS